MTSEIKKDADGIPEPTHLMVVPYNSDAVFDRVASVGDGGSALGTRFVAAMLMNGRTDFRDTVGLLTYGIQRPDAVPAPKVIEAADGIGFDWALTVQWADGTETVEHVSSHAARLLGYVPAPAPDGDEGKA